MKVKNKRKKESVKKKKKILAHLHLYKKKYYKENILFKFINIDKKGHFYA